MSIAQHTVASEGDAHPLENQSSHSASASSISCCTRNLPHLTLRAHQRALSMTTLPLRARCALASVVLTVDCRRPLKEVFAHRDYLSERAGMSERTWYRAEADLVKAGLVTIAEQGRKARHGRFGSAYIYLTETAAKLLGLIGAPDLKARATNADGEPAAKQHQRQAATQSSEVESSDILPESADSFISPSATKADPYTNDFYQSPSFQKRQQGALPRDLERLLSLGFHKNLIFKLMKEARVAGKFLSDVVECCWEPLKKANRPIPYLRALLAKTVDFSHQARQRAADEQRSENQSREKNELTEIVSKAAGKTFIDNALDLVVTFNDAGNAAEVMQPGESRPRYAAGSALLDLARGIRDGRLQRHAADGAQQSMNVRGHEPAVPSLPTRDKSVSLMHAGLMRNLLKRATFAAA